MKYVWTVLAAVLLVSATVAITTCYIVRVDTVARKDREELREEHARDQKEIAV